MVTMQERYATLDLELLAEALRELPEWRVSGGRLLRTVRTPALWPLLEQVRDVEEELDHHAVVSLEAGSVTFGLWTHVRGAVTRADVDLAQRIEDLVVPSR